MGYNLFPLILKRANIFLIDDIKVEIIDDHEISNDGEQLLQLVISDINSEELQIDKDQSELIGDYDYDQSEFSTEDFDQLESINNDSDQLESINNDSDQSEFISIDSDQSESSEDVIETATSEENIFETTVHIVETSNDNDTSENSDTIIDSDGDIIRKGKAIGENAKNSGNSLRRVRKKKRRRKPDKPCSVSKDLCSKNRYRLSI